MKMITSLTKAQEKKIIPYRDKWIEIGLKTGETDWKTFNTYMPICYKKAGLIYPKNIVKVNSPLVGGLAAAVAEAILRKKHGTVGDAVRDAVEGAVEIAVRGSVGGTVGGAIGSAVGDAVGDAVEGAVGSAVGGDVEGAVEIAVRGSVGGTVGGAVDSAVGGDVRSTVDNAVEGAIGSAVEGAVEIAVRGSVGGTVGGAVDSAVGGDVRSTVDNAVEGAVEKAISIAKKDGVTLSWHSWLGGQFWVGGWYWGVAFANFFFDICKLKLSKDIMERACAYRKVCESVNYIWPNKDFVMVCARPTHIDRNAQGRLHSTTRMAIQYPDGWGVYALNGVVLDEKLFKKVTNPKVKPAEIFAIENMEQRRVAYEIMDKTKMKRIEGKKTLDTVKDDGYGYTMELIDIPVKGFDKPFRYLHCVCPSTGREYFLQAQGSKTCQEAKMGSFGKSAEDRFGKEY